MKKQSLLMFVLAVSLNMFASETVYKLSEAIQKKFVSVKLKGAKADTSLPYTSSHVGPCMAMEIVSTADADLNLNLEYGYKLEPVDTGTQTMMVTQTLIVQLKPKQKKNYRIYAMCTEATDGAPSPLEVFNLGKRAAGNLLNLAELINRKKYQTDAAQNAIWCFTNDHDLSTIYDTDTTMMYELRRFVAKAKGFSLKQVYDANNNYSSAPVAQPQRIIHTRTVYSGSLSYSFSGTSKVLIALFDEDNHMKRVYVNNETQHEGEYTYNYEIGSDEMDDKKHYLRLFRNGRLEEEIAIIPRE